VYVIDRPDRATRVLISKHTFYRFTRNPPYMTKSSYFLTRYDVYAPHDRIVFYGGVVTHAARFRRIIFILLFLLIRPASLVNRPK